ncbi:MAG: HDOD domain-containing protein [Sulfurimonas sp.]|jgi:EAL and modified HD-GYP domain-containing signal transduction protein|nr:HDOD domain-containing protein [Sulfurimonas sp.]
MGKNLYIARQPILDQNEEVFAYELLYRDEKQTSTIENDRHATVAVLSNVLNRFGIKSLLGDHKAFIKVDKKFLMHEVFYTIPKEHFIFALQPNIKIDKNMRERIQKLHSLGYILAINDTLLEEEVYEQFFPIMDLISYIKVDIKIPLENLSRIKNLEAKTIFTKVESHELYEKAKKLQCDYIQGYFFSKPKILTQEKFDPSSLDVINIFNKLMSECSIDEIVEEFEKSHTISIQLLNFINSGNFHFRKKISSIRQILTLMGKTRLTQWLMFMVYSGYKSDLAQQDTPLVSLVKSRTNLMVKVSQIIDKDNTQKLASKTYFTGVISLMDALFNVKLEIILEELNIDEEIKEALMFKKGKLGEIYKFAIDLELFHIAEIEAFCTKYSINMEDIETLTLENIKNANGYEEQNA